MATLRLNAKQLILNANSNIERNIDALCPENYGLCAQNILSQARNLIDGIALLEYSKINPDLKGVKNGRDYIANARSNLKANRKKFKPINELYGFLEIVSSHYTQNEFNSISLLLKYSDMLVETKNLVKELYGLDILNNIDKYPFEIRNDQKEYYSLVYNKMINLGNNIGGNKHTYYIEKKRRIHVSGLGRMYEMVLSPANDSRTKFDRLTVYTPDDINDKHPINCSIIEAPIGNIKGIKLTAFYINEIMISIRPCELNVFAFLENFKLKIDRKSPGYIPLMNILTEENITLYDFIFSEDFDDKIKTIRGNKTNRISEFLAFTREKLNKQFFGKNTLKYLLYNLKHNILKEQSFKDEEHRISDTNLSTGCYPFEKLPFAMSLIKHNPSQEDLMYCLSEECNNEQLLYRELVKNCEERKHLYSSVEELNKSYVTLELAKAYNESGKSNIDSKILSIENDQYMTISGYESDTISILKELLEKSKIGEPQYEVNATKYLLENSPDIDDNKKDILKKAFKDSSVAFIKGSAGTGKTTIIKHFANIFKDCRILFMTCTNSALQNLKRRVGIENGRKVRDFITFDSFVQSRRDFSIYDILVADECSMVSNSLMCKTLRKHSFKKLILAGDDHQIESIRFGIWFEIAGEMIQNSCHELSFTHRTTNSDLKTIWDLTRDNCPELYERMVAGDFVKELSNDVFLSDGDDEVILCLNYDGLYGINNINKYMQTNNSNKSISWKVWTFKKNDKILFNDCYLLRDYFYNNQKGLISNIEEFPDYICFYIVVDAEPNSNKNSTPFVHFIEELPDGKLLYSIYVYKQDDDEEDGSKLLVVPFQLSYALTIHKSQGLEYDTVKVILTKEIEESISYNIFYTAITRAKKKLIIYCDNGSLEKIIHSFKRTDLSEDLKILKKKL